MGRPIIVQKRGKASPRYRAPSHRFKSDASYRGGDARGVVVGFMKDPSKTSLLMRVAWHDGSKGLYIAPEGIAIEDEVVQASDAGIAVGNVLPLESIPEGVPIFNIENAPGDGGKAVRASGGGAFIVAKRGDKAMVRLPSKRVKPFNTKCKAKKRGKKYRRKKSALVVVSTDDAKKACRNIPGIDTCLVKELNVKRPACPPGASRQGA